MPLMAKPQVAIIGRVNVGKSTLFNRLIGHKKAVVEPTPGVTRDRLYDTVEHQGRSFLLVDTGGLIGGEDDPLLREVTKQAEVALTEADVIVFLVDGREGLVGPDHDIAQLVRKSGRPYVFAASKMESPKLSVEDFLDLRLGEPLAISGLRGDNVPLLLDAVVEALPPERPEAPDESDAIHVAVVGRPNVGKSLLVNAIVGVERVIVSDLPGTTRDAIDVGLRRDGREFVLVDTAGLRRKSRVKAALEYYATVRSLRAIDRADVVLVLLDASEGMAEQDLKIAGYAHEQGRAIILVANKWDLVQASAREETEEPAPARGRRRASRGRIERTLRRDFEAVVRRYAPFLEYAPLVFVSALKRTGIRAVLDHVVAAAESHSRRVSTGELNRAIIAATERNSPPLRKGRQLRIYYATQPETRPPTIVLFVNDPKLMHFAYERYLTNQLRHEFGFHGTPIRLFVRARREEQRDGRRASRRKRPARARSTGGRKREPERP